MKKLNITLNGTTPLLMNSNQGVNPTHPLTIELKKYTGKRKKTDEDHIEILKIKWFLALYHDDEIGPYIPAQNVEATIRDAAKRSKRGKDVKIGIRVDPDFIPLIYEGPRDKATLWDDPNHRDIRVGRIKASSVMVSRPRFNRWKINFALEYDEDIFNESEISDILNVAGRYVGLCDYRERYGHFEVVIQNGQT